MNQFVVYKNPLDFPGKFVLRRFVIEDDGTIKPDAEPIAVVDIEDGIDAIRTKIPFVGGLVRVPRDGRDDPVIEEVWL